MSKNNIFLKASLVQWQKATQSFTSSALTLLLTGHVNDINIRPATYNSLKKYVIFFLSQLFFISNLFKVIRVRRSKYLSSIFLEVWDITQFVFKQMLPFDAICEESITFYTRIHCFQLIVTILKVFNIIQILFSSNIPLQ